MHIISLEIASVLGFARLVGAGKLHLRAERLRKQYKVENAGVYEIFRETISSQTIKEEKAVLVVGFQLRLIGKNVFLHWLFQRLCILTTPFWSGYRGFRVKLWMVDQKSKGYLGIYQWQGVENAKQYVLMLVQILCPLSTKGSVWYKIYPKQQLTTFLASREHSRR